jgi:hypothetical protein
MKVCPGAVRSLLIQFLVFHCLPIFAAPPKNKTKQKPATTRQVDKSPKPAPAPVADSTSFLQVTISPSTPQILKSSVYSIDVLVKNISSKPVLINTASILLAVEPELGPPQSGCTSFYSPHLNKTIKITSYQDPLGGGTANLLTLQPQERITLFFNLGESNVFIPEGCTLGRWEKLGKTFDFIPGVYTFDLSGNFVTDETATTPSSPAQGQSKMVWQNPRIFSESTTLRVGIEQSAILFFAALGGLLAYVLMDIRQKIGGDIGSIFSSERPREALYRIFIFAKNAIGASFLSAATTVVASRLSGTEFPVKVSVNDFWGALTVGFVSFFVGGKFIEKLADLRKP